MYRRNGRGRLLLLAFVALSILIITLEFRSGRGGPLDRAKDLSMAVVAPIQRGFTTVFRPVGNFFSSIGELGSLRSENAELKEEVEEARALNRRAEAIVSENTRMAEMLQLEKSYLASDPVTARVISNAPANYRWAVVIDKGSSSGIAPDMAVIAPEGLVGKVTQVGTDHATVLLLMDPRGAARARIAGGKDAGLVTGKGAADSLSLELIGPESEVELDDEVITAGYDRGIFPPGIPIGVVSDISGDVREPEREIEVDPYVDFASLDFVQVLIESGPRLTLKEGS